MADKPFSENLISGYLDNQLTAEERAEVEKRLREDSDAAQLLDQLRANSEGLAKLPRFQLSDEFSSRVLEHKRVKEVFSSRSGAASHASDDSKSHLVVKSEAPSAYPISSRFGAAAAAIASLAALVLITLFVQIQDSTGTVEIAQSATDESRRISEKPATAMQSFDYEGNTAGGVNLDRDSIGLGSIATGESEQPKINTIRQQPKQFFDNGQVMNELGKNIQNQKFFPKDEMALPRGLEPSEIEDAPLNGETARFANKSELADATIGREGASRAKKEAGSNVHDFDARKSRSMHEQVELRTQKRAAATPNLPQPLARKETASKGYLPLNDVFEVQYSAVSDVGKFRDSLQRNGILLQSVEMPMGQTAKLTDGKSVSDAQQQTELFGAWSSPQSKSDASAFVVIASPSQVSGLISDVNQAALVTRYELGVDRQVAEKLERLNELGDAAADKASKSPARARENLRFETRPQANVAAGQESDESKADSLEQIVDRESNAEFRKQTEIAGGAAVVANEITKNSMPGLAQQLRQDSLSSDSLTPGAKQPKQMNGKATRAVTSADSRGNDLGLQKLKAYLQEKAKQGQRQQYLFIVRAKESPLREMLATELEPNSESKPLRKPEVLPSQKK